MTASEAPKALLDNVRAFTAFARRRLGDPDLAADAVQQALLAALRHEDQLRSDARLLPWFWRILRNTIADLQRRRHVEQERSIAAVPGDELPAEEHERVCACLDVAIDTLPSDAGELLRSVDLGDTPLAAAAEARGITVDNLNVRRHRARKKLHDAMLATCRVCAEHGCVDCDCDRSPSRGS